MDTEIRKRGVPIGRVHISLHGINPARGRKTDLPQEVVQLPPQGRMAFDRVDLDVVAGQQDHVRLGSHDLGEDSPLIVSNMVRLQVGDDRQSDGLLEFAALDAVMADFEPSRLDQKGLDRHQHDQQRAGGGHGGQPGTMPPPKDGSGRQQDTSVKQQTVAPEANDPKGVPAFFRQYDPGNQGHQRRATHDEPPSRKPLTAAHIVNGGGVDGQHQAVVQ